jgi:hypothetical protein
MARGYFGTRNLSGFKVASLFIALVVVMGAVLGTAASSFALDGRDGNAYVNYHRDRLLDTYAQYKGLGNRVNAWNSLNYKQKMLFLIQTDLLGNRTFMRPTETRYYKSFPDDGCGDGNDFCGTCRVMGGYDYCNACQVYAVTADYTGCLGLLHRGPLLAFSGSDAHGLRDGSGARDQALRDTGPQRWLRGY